MVTKAVNMDLKVNAPNGNKPRETDGGFSDVLGNVSSENRKQQGLSNSSRKDFGKEFSFTQKASERAVDRQDSMSGVKSDDAGMSADKGGFDPKEADRLLSQAAETVVRKVSEGDESPTKEEAAEMMSDALKGIASEKKQNAQAEVAAAEPEDELLEALVDVISAMADDTGTAVQGDVPVTEEEPEIDEPTVHVITPDSSFLLTEKHVEAAMIAESGARQPVMMPMAEDGETFAAELGEMLDNGFEPDYGYLLDDERDLGLFVENAKEMFAGRTEFREEIFTDGSDLLKKVLAKIDSENAEGSEPVAEMQVVKDAAEMLSQIIDEAKKKLGLTDVRYERVNPEEPEADAAPIIRDESVRLSRGMNKSDRTGELDHILNEGRTDAPEEGDAPKTQTYDAVHMASELMGGRTDTDIPIERTPMPEETPEIRPPEIQTAEQILDRIQHMQDDHMEFTMVLNPESLGRITVKLVMAGERTAVEINAENPETRAILAARSENLQSMLRENGVELERYQVVSEQEDTQFRQQSYEGSSKNPYGRNDDGEGQDKNDDENGESFYDLLGNL